MIELDGYEQIDLVGAGGLADVYRAVHAVSGAEVAIKVLRDLSDPAATRRRVDRELTALRALAGHEHVIAVSESLELATGPARVMEYAPGGSVADLLGRNGGSIRIEEAVLIGRQVASALAAAHSLGIVHRDVKPDNLLIDASGQVRLCDFGIAALLHSTDSPERTRAVSPRYASPEDLDEEGEPTPASDVYSLGATLLHLVHGAPPTLKERLAPWSAPVTADIDITAVDEIIASCLQPDPDERATADEVRRRLEVVDWTLAKRCRALDADMADATIVRGDRPPPIPLERPLAASTRRRQHVAAAAAVLVMLTFGAALWWSVGAATTPQVPVSKPSTDPTTSVSSPRVAAPVTIEPSGARALTSVPLPKAMGELDPATTWWPFGDVGECLVQVHGLDELMPVDCAEPHDLQRFAVGRIDELHDITAAAFPADAVHLETDEACLTAFTGFVGTAPADSTLRIGVTRPSAATWAEGDRSYQCLLGERGHHLVGDARGSGA